MKTKTINKALKKQLCYASGTLGGWALGKLIGAKEMIPFTVIGGLAGFAFAEQFVEGKAVLTKHPVAGLPVARRSTKKRQPKHK